MKLTSIQHKEIHEVLASFGFNKKDEEVYLALFELGKTTLLPLAQKLGAPPTTIHSTMKRLIERGVVDVSKQKSRSVYEARDPNIFKTLLTEQAKGIAGIIPLLQSLRTEQPDETRIKIFERERVADILHESLKTSSKQVFEIVSAKDFQEVIGEKFHYTRRRIQKGVHLKSLRVRTHEIKKYTASTHTHELREAKFLPTELTFHGSILFWDDTVAFFTTKSEGVHLMITSKTLRELSQQLFELLWSVSGKMET